MSTGKIFIPFDLRGTKKGATPISILIDDEEEPSCLRMDVMDDRVHVQIKIDERGAEALFDKLMELRLQFARERAFERGAAHALRKRRTKE